MNKLLGVGLYGMALTISIAHAQPSRPGDAQFIPSAQQKLIPDKSGFYSQAMLSQNKNGMAMITARDKSGEAEAHADRADHIFVQDGAANLILGGTIEHPRQVSAGETRGSGVSGGKTIALHPGDYFYVPANTAHRMILAPGQSIRYAVVKARP